MNPNHPGPADPAVLCNVERQRTRGRKRKPYDGQRQDLTRDKIDKLFAALRRRRTTCLCVFPMAPAGNAILSS